MSPESSITGASRNRYFVVEVDEASLACRWLVAGSLRGCAQPSEQPCLAQELRLRAVLQRHGGARGRHPTAAGSLVGQGGHGHREHSEDGYSPPHVSVVDVVAAITGMTGANAGHYYERLRDSHPEVCTICTNYRFPGRGQRNTPVTDARGIVEIIMLLPGRHAARVRRQAAELLVRYLTLRRSR